VYWIGPANATDRHSDVNSSARIETSVNTTDTADCLLSDRIANDIELIGPALAGRLAISVKSSLPGGAARAWMVSPIRITRKRPEIRVVTWSLAFHAF
jgi:hypothetical protein